MCKRGNTKIVKLPDNICDWKKTRKVSIDACIVKPIKALWNGGYETLGCCCGHGKERPSVVIHEAYNRKSISKIAKILAESDSRRWSIMQWKLQTVEIM